MRAMPEPVPAISLPLARFRLTFAPAAAVGRREFAALRSTYLGSAWRGAFGRALKEAVCVTGLPECGACALVDCCAYPFLFESRTPTGAGKLSRYPFTPGPYVFEPGPVTREALRLGVTLFGPAVEHLPTLVQALSRAAVRGITSNRVALTLTGVEVERARTGQPGEWHRIYGPKRHDKVLHALSPMACDPPPGVPEAVRLRLLSPMRIRRNGRNVGPDDLDARALAGTLLRRVSLLTYFFSDRPLETDFAGLVRHADSVSVVGRELLWRDGARRSSRQGATVPLGGVVGRFELHGDLAPLWPFLWIGQWAHVGKACSMGLGRYVVDAVGGVPNVPWSQPAVL